MRLELLSKEHAETLFQFELENREWFESTIPARDSEFYSLQGVRQHIQLFLLDYTAKTLIPMLIIDDCGKILGRVNVTKIDRKKHQAHIGYRVGKAFTNRGVAKFGVKSMIRMVEKLGIRELIAYASLDNIASRRVLEACGFRLVRLMPNYTELNNLPLDYSEFKLSIR